MAPNLKPFTLYTLNGPGPNPWKVRFILEELGLAYETIALDFAQVKGEEFIKVNPNGRAPGFIDPNKDITLWESGAIIDYLIAEYDPDNTLQYTTFPEKYTTRAWEHYQMSGQGPYFGQFAWFTFFHPDRLPSAVERYEKEIKRVTGVLDAHLAKTGKPFLVGDKCTYADIMFVPYYVAARDMWKGKIEYTEDRPAFNAWLARLLERPAVKKVAGDYEEEIAGVVKARDEQEAAAAAATQ